MNEEYLEAIRAFNHAKANFNNAEPDFFEAAQERVNALVKEMKK